LRNNKGFTIIEMMVVLVILFIIFSIITDYVKKTDIEFAQPEISIQVEPESAQEPEFGFSDEF